MSFNLENFNNWVDTITNTAGQIGNVVSQFANTANQNRQNNTQPKPNDTTTQTVSKQGFNWLYLLPLALLGLLFIKH